MLTILMIVRSTFYSVRGGDTIQVTELAKRLNEKNSKVDIKKTDEIIDYTKYDLLHFFNIIRPADILYHIKRSGKPYVVSPIFVDYSEFDKFHRGMLTKILFKYLSRDAIEYIKAIARWVFGNDRLVSRSYLWKGQKRSIEEIIKNAKLLLPNSHSEWNRLEEAYQCKANYLVVHNGVDATLFKPDLTIKKDDLLILCVARFEGLKNQLNLIKAINNTKYRLVLIGRPSPNQMQYYKECLRTAASNITILDHLPQAELVDFYNKARVHILPSYFETTGLSSLEAAAMGCNIVITEKGDAKEYFGDHAFYCDPSSPASIYAAIQAASVAKVDFQFCEHIRSSFSWDEATSRTMKAYESINLSCV